jgi:hypothetical protein
MLGIAVPCYKYHIPMLKRFLDSVANQNRQPDFVVVSCSSSSPEDIPPYEYSFKLEILVHSNRLNASQNRNIAADRLIEFGCEYISFFDCDDEMHPQRIQAIQTAIQEYSADIILHNYVHLTVNLEDEFEKYESFIMDTNKVIVRFNEKEQPFFNKNIHASQLCVKRDVFNDVRFCEDRTAERLEDTIFLIDILKLQNYNHVYILNPLSKYYAEGQWHP